uniref:RNA helicase n=1 Tax=Globisporangium ultimum (strain ATCC 200006 / CBS 805.95 / DAOM BR144) TaxID=431595 RepID=K3W5Y1_GLOUD
MAGKKRKHGGGSAAAHAKAQKKKAKQLAAAAAQREAAADEPSAAFSDDVVMENDAVEVAAHDEIQGDSSKRDGDDDGQTDILSAELREELGGTNGDVMVIVGKKKKKKSAEDVVPEELVEQATRLSKSKRKKLEHIAARKVKEARREDLYKSLESKSLSKEQLNLMLTTSKLGHKETLRERLRRSMNRVNAGIELSSEDQQELVQQRDAPPMQDGDDAESSSEDDDENEGAEAKKDDSEAKATKSRKKKNKTASSASASSEIDVSASAPQTVQVTSDDSNLKKDKKKKRAVVVNHVVPLQEDAAGAGSMDTSSTTPIAVAAAQKSMEDTGSASAPRSTSQNDAMARLEALRKKNEERRRQKELSLTQPAKPAAATVDEDASMDPADVYVPTPILIKTTAEMKELSKKTKLSYKNTLVQLKRKPEIQLARMQLPVCSSEQEIMEAITDNDVIILCGETGSGKTTQVPQFLYEAGYGHPEHPQFSGRIGVTQPRRVAAVSTAKRVAEELNVNFGSKGHVGYQIRYDAEHVGELTRIKFMTDGILLKEIQQDFLLRHYSILLLDEAHERNVNTDILIGLLSRIAPLRAQMAKEEQEAFQLLSKEEQEDPATPKPIQPLKLVVMSATLRVEDFTKNERLFPKSPPVLRVDARQYPVTVHFNKRTELDDYVSEAYKKVVKIHKKLPEGGVLVFLTGQREILQLCRKLRRAYSVKDKAAKKAVGARAPERHTRMDVAPRTSAKDRILREHDDIEEEADLEDAQVYGDDENVSYDLDEDEKKEYEESEDEEDDEDDEELPLPYMHVLPLYSLMPNDEQMRVFDPPPEKHRLIVVATNVAETSLTIPGIKYVVDAGRTKERVFDLNNGISSFDIQWISKASADQRAGRAGRTGPGHCYRLYSSAVYDTEFAKFSAPEILCQPIEDLVLQMKAMGIHNVLQFPFPTPPDRQAVKMALSTLVNLGAISEGDDEAITPLGHVLVKFPVAARFAKMLLLAKELNVLEYTIAIVAGLSGHSPFIQETDRREKEKHEKDDAEDGDKSKEPEDDMEKEWREAEEQRKHAQWFDAESDVLSLLRAAGAYAYTGGSSQFCQENHLHEKTMQNMLKLRQQLTRIVNLLYAEDEDDSGDAFTPIKLSPRMPPPDHETQIILRQIVAAGFLDQVAKRVPPGTIAEGTKIERNCAFIAATGNVKEPVYIHPHSSVFTPNPAKLPAFVVYQHIMRTTRAYMKMVTSVEPGWLASIGKNTPMCKYSPPLAEPSPSYNSDLDQVQCYAKAQYGVHQWVLPVVQIAYPEHDQQDEKDGLAGKYRWFAKFVLDGQVIPGLKPFSGSALREPSHMLIRKKFDKKIQLLVHKLQKHKVGSRAQLIAMWRDQDATFLRTELKAWIKDDQQALFTKSWKAIVQQATRE